MEKETGAIIVYLSYLGIMLASMLYLLYKAHMPIKQKKELLIIGVISFALTVFINVILALKGW